MGLVSWISRKKEDWKALLETYGSAAIATYLAIFALTISGFAAAIQAGVDVEGGAGTAGVWGAAWVATKITQPLRIGATVVLTPVVARLMTSRKQAGERNQGGKA